MEDDRVWFIATQTVAWDNDPKVLCFNCELCKARLLDNIKSDYKKMDIGKMEFLVASLLCTPSGAVLQEQQCSHWNRYQLATRLD
jgi:hypothetical protein